MSESKEIAVKSCAETNSTRAVCKNPHKMCVGECELVKQTKPSLGALTAKTAKLKEQP